MATSRKAPLSAEAFRDALTKGLGRAFLHVRNHGIAGVEDELRHACLNCLVFEPIIEGIRTSWLYAILKRSGKLECYCADVLQRLRNAHPENASYYDFLQAIALAAHFAKAGNNEAYRLVYVKFTEQLFGPYEGASEIVELDGLAGLTHVAEIVGCRLRKESDLNPIISLPSRS